MMRHGIMDDELTKHPKGSPKVPKRTAPHGQGNRQLSASVLGSDR